MPNMIQACSDFDGAPVFIVNTRPDKVSLKAWGVPPDLLLKSSLPQETALGGADAISPDHQAQRSGCICADTSSLK